MRKNLIIVDDFYTNPYEVREYALGLNFETFGNYPGVRSCPESDTQSNYLKEYFEKNIVHSEIYHWHNDYNTCYQYTTENAKTWVHQDETDWAGVLYLTPDAPVKSGTGIYKAIVDNPDENILNNWEQVDFIGNIFNRLVVYRGSLFHRSVLPGFGKDKETGRLFQTFFFNTGD